MEGLREEKARQAEGERSVPIRATDLLVPAGGGRNLAVIFAVVTWQPGLGSSFRRYILSVSGVFFWQRVLFGLAGPALLSCLTWETAKIRSTQSATGILYVDFFTIVVGEVLAKYLLLATSVPV